MQDTESVFCGLFVNVGWGIHICKLHEVFCILCFMFIIFSICCFGKKELCTEVSCVCWWCSACLNYQMFLLNYNYFLLRPKHYLACSKSHLTGES